MWTFNYKYENERFDFKKDVYTFKYVDDFTKYFHPFVAIDKWFSFLRYACFSSKIYKGIHYYTKKHLYIVSFVFSQQLI